MWKRCQNNSTRLLLKTAVVTLREELLKWTHSHAQRLSSYIEFTFWYSIQVSVCQLPAAAFVYRRPGGNNGTSARKMHVAVAMEIVNMHNVGRLLWEELGKVEFSAIQSRGTVHWPCSLAPKATACPSLRSKMVCRPQATVSRNIWRQCLTSSYRVDCTPTISAKSIFPDSQPFQKFHLHINENIYSIQK